MLQIIGWLGCLYLLVKALEISAGAGNRGEDGALRGQAVVAVGLAVGGALIFAVWFLAQGSAMAFMPGADMADLDQRAAEAEATADCMESKATIEEMSAC